MSVMNIAIWILQGVLGAMFMMSGTMKATSEKSKLAVKMPWVNDYSAGMVKFIGVSQLLGGIGLIVPWATGILPILTPIAGVGLALVMLLAAIYHLGKKEYNAIGINALLGGLALVIAIARFM
jgi:uncharacterized membrane protein YphA (DoxX/SURF4 family)